jgi:hypothetical protein
VLTLAALLALAWAVVRTVAARRVAARRAQ